MENKSNNRVKARLKKMYTCLTLAATSTILSAGALGFSVYELSNEKDSVGITALLASLIGAAAAVKFGQRAAHHRRVYKSIRPSEESPRNNEVGVEKTLSSQQSKKMVFFSSKKELKAYRKEKHRREREAKKAEEMTK